MIISHKPHGQFIHLSLSSNLNQMVEPTMKAMQMLMQLHKVAAAGLIMGISSASFANVATGSSQAQIQIGIGLSQQQALDFGTILPDTAGDTAVLIDPSITSTSGGSSFAGDHQHAVFLITGEPSTAYTVQISESASLTGAGTAMVVNTFTGSFSGSLDESGNRLASYGASLVINASQTPGVYTGTYDITVNYL